ncbi:aldose epimerase, partial [Vibrio parahaemolyticus]
MDLKTLPPLTVLSDNVTVVEIDNVKIVRIIHDKATAGIALHGGHVVSYAPQGQEDLIWMSEKPFLMAKQAFTWWHSCLLAWFGRIAVTRLWLCASSE